MNGKLEEFTREAKRLEYLATINDADLLETYYPAIIRENCTPISNFTNDELDIYIRLKFRA